MLAVFATKRRDRKAARAFLKRAMARFRDIKTLQKFASAHASIHNHFNHDRHLDRRDIFKQNRSAALAEWLRRRAQTKFQTSRYKAVATRWTLL